MQCVDAGYAICGLEYKVRGFPRFLGLDVTRTGALTTCSPTPTGRVLGRTGRPALDRANRRVHPPWQEQPERNLRRECRADGLRVRVGALRTFTSRPRRTRLTRASAAPQIPWVEPVGNEDLVNYGEYEYQGCASFSSPSRSLVLTDFRRRRAPLLGPGFSDLVVNRQRVLPHQHSNPEGRIESCLDFCASKGASYCGASVPPPRLVFLTRPRTAAHTHCDPQPRRPRVLRRVLLRRARRVTLERVDAPGRVDVPLWVQGRAVRGLWWEGELVAVAAGRSGASLSLMSVLTPEADKRGPAGSPCGGDDDLTSLLFRCLRSLSAPANLSRIPVFLSAETPV